jgi:inner membrane protein YidH
MSVSSWVWLNRSRLTSTLPNAPPLPTHQADLTMMDQGRDPDYRFTLANERTLLAWLRTALALLAAGVAVVHLVPDLGLPGARRVIGTILAGLGATIAITSMLRWRAVQAAMRRGEDLPPARAPLLVSITLAVLSLMVLVLLILHGNTV